ncbi:MAG: hypothetical protein A2066_12555 [Bacteroidetes bacterium GWB2_41_8]|nr:MAG: hypothetical protein A2066_12555 [Bacteroidetes bacterium GWB2_41_8]
MMQLKRHINPDFPVIHPYSGVDSITDELFTYGYLAVIDENSKFWGILTPMDLLKRPHKIVADCLTLKDVLTDEDNIAQALEKFLANQSVALPFFNCNQLVGIVEKETLTKHILKSIDELFDKSGAADRLKRLLLANLSHEIRTPLNSIVGFLELIEDISADDAQYSDFSSTIRNSAEHFLIFMNDLIDLSLIQAGHSFDISIVSCKLSLIFKETKDLFLDHFLYSDKDVLLLFNNCHEEITIQSDTIRLKRILYHLIDSAIRALTKGKIEFGYNLPENKQVRIFLKMHIEKFADEQLTFLAIPGKNVHPEEGISFHWIKELAKLLNGSLSYEEISENQHNFYFSLPYQPVISRN